MRHLVLFLTLLAPLAARAADCPSGSHLATSDEKGFYKSAMPTLRDAMPKPPAGWKVSNQTDIQSSLAMVCNEPDKNPMRLVHFIRFERVDGMDQRRAALKAAQDSATVPTPEQKKKLEKLEAQEKKLTEQAEAAADRGKQAQQDKLLEQISKVTEQEDAIKIAMHNNADKAVEKALLRDCEALVDVLVNPAFVDLRGGPVQKVNVEGATAAYRLENGGRDGPAGWKEGATYAFYGEWKAAETGAGTQLTANLNKKKSTNAQSVVVRVVADKDRALQLLKDVQMKSILALTK